MRDRGTTCAEQATEKGPPPEVVPTPAGPRAPVRSMIRRAHSRAGLAATRRHSAPPPSVHNGIASWRLGPCGQNGTASQVRHRPVGRSGPTNAPHGTGTSCSGDAFDQRCARPAPGDPSACNSASNSTRLAVTPSNRRRFCASRTTTRSRLPTATACTTRSGPCRPPRRPRPRRSHHNMATMARVTATTGINRANQLVLPVAAASPAASTVSAAIAKPGQTKHVATPHCIAFMRIFTFITSLLMHDVGKWGVHGHPGGRSVKVHAIRDIW